MAMSDWRDRCIKANSQKKPRIFEGASCLEQLQCAGVFEAVTIRKSGFPFRYTFERFVERYKCVLATEQVRRASGESQRATMRQFTQIN